MEPGWRKTWEDSDDDYVYLDATGRAARPRFCPSQRRTWQWFSLIVRPRGKPCREAPALAVELAHERSASR